MRNLLVIALVSLLIGCSSTETEDIYGKWYTYTESGDYMELWLGDDKAITYLSAIDEFLLYDLNRSGSKMSFVLLESDRFNEHEFSLDVYQVSDKLFQSVFIGGPRVDSLKTYFLVDAGKPKINESLAGNQELMEDLFERLSGESHEGHGH